MKTFRQINYIFDRRQKFRLFLLAVIILFGTVVELVGVSSILPFVNVIMSPDVIEEKWYLKKLYDFFHCGSSSQFLILLAAFLICVYIVKSAYLIFMYDTQIRFVFNNMKRLSTRMLVCYMEQDYLFHLSHNSAELIRNVASDTSGFFTAVLAAIQLATEGSVALVLVVFLFLQDRMITIVVAILLGIYALVFTRMFKNKIKILGEQGRDINAELSKWLLQAFGGIKETKIFNKEQFFIDMYDEEFVKYVNNQRRYQLYKSVPRPVLETTFVSGLLAVIIFKLLRGADLTYLVPTLSAFAVAAIRLIPSFNRLTGFFGDLIYNIASVDAIYNDLVEIDEIREQKRLANLDAEPIRFEREIRVEKLTFRYPNVEEYVLDNAGLKLEKKQSIAFIGSSGAGKTTLADIFLGILNPESGGVFVDGVDIAGHMGSWHKLLGYIPQTIFLLDDTLRNNVAFGIRHDEIDDEKVWKALESAQLKDFVKGLENGLDTSVGERGVRLSGGQRQRIGIARALYSDPEILVLDEATSALDNETETAVMEAINSLQGNKTLIIIAHRLTTIRNCDIIYEVKDRQVTVVDKDKLFEK